MSYDILLWDLDGTLTDPKEGITRSVQYSLNRLGSPFPSSDDLEWVIGPPLSESFKILLQSEDESLIEQAVLFYRERYQDKGMFENLPYPGIPELLSGLQKRGKINILATAKPQVFAEQILNHFKLSSYFNIMMGSRLNGELTDKGELINKILNRLSKPLTDKKIVMIGDRSYDIKGAQKNNIDSVAVTYGYGSFDELKNSCPTHIISNVHDLHTLLLG